MKKFYSMIIWLFGVYMSVSFSSASKIYLVSETDSLISNCENNIDIMIDTQWEEIFGASINMSYDRKNIEIVWLYLNDDFNLPLANKITKDDELWNIQSAELSLIRDSDFNQKWFVGLVKYGTLVIKNKEPISITSFDFLFDSVWSTVDNVDVFRLWDARDILTNAEWGTFDFVDGVCLHEAPSGGNQMDENYDLQSNLDKNLQNIAMVENVHKYKLFFMDYGVYGLMLLLALLLIYIMRKKWIIKNKKLLADKENKNV